MIRYLKNMEKEIIIDNNLSEVNRITQFVQELGMSLRLSTDIIMSVNLAIEEAITNIIYHAYPTGKKSEIMLRVSFESDKMIFLIEDDGLSFDPVFGKADSAPLTLEQMLTEGLGLFLIRRTMDEVTYSTMGVKNQLSLMKRVETTFELEATMKTNLCKIDDVIILSIKGRLDTLNTREFERVIQPLLTQPTPKIFVNCEELSYISSSGLRSFILLQKSVMSHNGCLVLEAMSSGIRKIFDMTGCSSVFTIR